MPFAVAFAALFAVLAFPAGVVAGPGALDAQRWAELERGTAAQRTEVLAWLADHGSPADTPAVVPRLKDADETVRQMAEVTLWTIWLRSGDEQADLWMKEGMALLSAGALEASINAFSLVIRRLPEFAEGYNKRATALYLNGDFEASLRDIATTLRLNPDHFGALSGAGLCLARLHRLEEAQFYFERALAVNPNMDGVRAMLQALRANSPRQGA
jgi:tetratricopeptide (TPR) repeat protein